MSNVLKIPHKLPTLNEYIQVERTNRFMAAKLKADTQNIIAMYTQQLDMPTDGTYDVYVEWTTADQRTDSDNIYFAIKFILDAVVAAGKLKGDSPKYIRHISHQRYRGKQDTVVIRFVSAS